MSSSSAGESSLEGLRVLVVGASSGMGRSIAIEVAREGAAVAVVGRHGESLDQLCAEIRALPTSMASRSPLPLVADVGDSGEAVRVVARAEVELGHLDVVVYAAGTNTRDRAIDRLQPSQWMEVIATNLDGAFYVTQAALPSMRRRRNGLLIYIGSGAAKRPDLSGAAYQASKAGLGALAGAVMEECRADGVRTTVIYAGMANTPFMRHRPTPPTPEALERALLPQDVTDACCFVMRLPARAHVPELLLYPAQS